METPSRKRLRLKRFSKKLNKNLAKSEIWFQDIYKKFRHSEDLINKPFQNQYIPDITNHRYKYVIEVDGSIHYLKHVKEHDTKKDIFYNLHGYRIFRIKAFDKVEFYKFLSKLYELRDIPYLRQILNKKN